MNKSKKEEKRSDYTLIFAFLINILLSIFQIIGGILSGSLSLIADALHNFSDAITIGLGLFARIIGRRPADKIRSFGYKRAEMIAAFINVISLIIIGFFLIYEAILRFIEPSVISGKLVIIVASIALIVDLATTIITAYLSRESTNMKVVYLHNLTDTLASVAVIIGGFFILKYDMYWIDTFLTLLIALYILIQSFLLTPDILNFFMDGTPKGINIDQIKKKIEEIDLVIDMHDIHVWGIDEEQNALEAHVIVEVSELNEVEKLKYQIKEILDKSFNISHSTLEFEPNLNLK
ncbi:MAG: cation transporter [Alphaproteobacteria bacterium]|jgi:cobalt-zinc-cadmium efflux system protein|nr:cation transporter [Alphaproteobacteria bacterium]